MYLIGSLILNIIFAPYPSLKSNSLNRIWGIIYFYFNKLINNNFDNINK